MAQSTVDNPKTNPAVLEHAAAVLPPLPIGVPTTAHSRFYLHCEAQVWRYLMDIGMALHKQCLTPPRPHPIAPDFRIRIPSTFAKMKGQIELVGYVPRGWTGGEFVKNMIKSTHEKERKGKGKQVVEKAGEDARLDVRLQDDQLEQTSTSRSQSQSKASPLLPALINFHGGGFTIGRATDDVFWARYLTHLSGVDAVVISVEYRLAPEYPFPIGVEDGADAVLFVMQHAEALGIDPKRIGTSGFSAGGNMAFSVPLRVYEKMRKRRESRADVGDLAGLVHEEEIPNVWIPPPTTPPLRCICAWYPSLDFTRSRAERRKTNTRPEKDLPKFFTDLFDASYLYSSPDSGAKISLDSPYLSPAVAPTDLLREALPRDVLMYTCEWDELMAEGERFKTRLETEEALRGHIRVQYNNVKGVVHAFDKSPNPFWRDPKVEAWYKDAAERLKIIFG